MDEGLGGARVCESLGAEKVGILSMAIDKNIRIECRLLYCDLVYSVVVRYGITMAVHCISGSVSSVAQSIPFHYNPIKSNPTWPTRHTTPSIFRYLK